MAKKNLTAAQKLKIFVDNLQINNQTTINRRFKKIAQKINAEYWNLKSESRNTYYIGSYGRGTAIKSNGNINILVVLNPEYFQEIDSYEGNGQIHLLKELKGKMIDIFPETVMKEEEKGEIIIPFKDGLIIEIIPAFLNPRGNYYYPNISDGGSWNEFNPIKEIEVINSMNYEYAGKIKHLAKMMRAWKYTNDVFLPGMLLDTLVMDFMEEWEGNDKSYFSYGSMTLSFFEYLAGKRDDKEYWYAKGSNRELQRTGVFGEQANTAYKNMLEALRYEDDGNYVRADKCWKEIFGKYFPV